MDNAVHFLMHFFAGQTARAHRILAVARLVMRTHITYRERWVTLAFTAFLPVIIAGLVLQALYKARVEGSLIAVFSDGALDTYYIAVAVIVLLSQVLLHEHISMHVREGTFSSILLLPVSGLEMLIGFVLGNMLFVWPAAAAVAGFGAWYAGGGLAIGQVLPVMLILMNCILIQGFISAIVGSSSFWFVHTTGVFALTILTVNFFGGMIIPIQLMPSALARAAEVLPFRFVYALPAEAISGGRDAVFVLLGQYGWLAALSLILLFLWRAGLRAFDAAGG